MRHWFEHQWRGQQLDLLLGNYYLPGALEQAIGDFIDHYSHHRYHESLGNSRPPTSISAGPKPS